MLPLYNRTLMHGLILPDDDENDVVEITQSRKIHNLIKQTVTNWEILEVKSGS